MSDTATISSALSTRDAKLQAHLKARSSDAVTLRDQIIKVKLELLKASPGSAEAKAAQSTLDGLLARRSSLMTDTDLDKAQVALSSTRRQAQAAAIAAAADKVKSMSNEELEKVRATLVAQRRALKIDLRAVMHELSSREATARVEKLVEALSADEKAKLLKALSGEK